MAPRSPGNVPRVSVAKRMAVTGLDPCKTPDMNAMVLMPCIDGRLINSIHFWHTDVVFSFVSKSNTYKADDGQHDDLVMSLVFFAWLTRQEYYADLVEQAKFNYEEASKPEDDNVLFVPDPKSDDDDGEFVAGGAVWYPT